MRVLVTGATGHIGNTLCRELVSRQRQVQGMVRPTSDRSSLKGLDIDLVEGNLLLPETLVSAAKGCSTIFHTAAVYKNWSAHPDLDIIRPAVEGTRNIFEAARKAGVRKVVYVSSVAAIGGGDHFDHHRGIEDWNTAATSPYNIAKTRSEQLALELADKYNINTVFVLPTMVLGRGDYKITPSTGLVRDFLAGKLPFYFDGAYSLVDVHDVTSGMLLAEERGQPGERYILGGTGVTVRELFELAAEMTTRSAPGIKLSKSTAKLASYPLKWIARIFHAQPMITPEMVEDNFDKYYNFSPEKAEEELGYTYRSITRVVEETIGWLIERGEVPADIRVVENQ